MTPSEPGKTGKKTRSSEATGEGTKASAKKEKGAAAKPSGAKTAAPKGDDTTSSTPPAAVVAKVTSKSADGWARGFAATAVFISLRSLGNTVAPDVLPPQMVGKLLDKRLLLLGVAQLRPALASSQPFHTEMVTLYKLIPENNKVRSVLETIAPAAREGIPTADQLRRRFSRVSQTVYLREFLPPNEAWLQRAVIFVNSVVPVLSGKNPSIITIRAAEARLRAGDLDGATSEIEKLSGASAVAAADWLEDAHRRLAANGALEALDTLASTQ